MTLANLPVNPLAPLVDEILAALPSLIVGYTAGVPLRVLAGFLGADIASVRRSAHQLNSQARAHVMRRMDSREQYLVPFRYRKAVGLRYCAHCGKTFALPPVKRTTAGPYYSDRCTCSRACAIAWSWNQPGVRERRTEGIKQERRTPAAKARTANLNCKRWSDPEQHKKVSEANRNRWSDPAKRADYGRIMRQRMGTAEKRQFYSELRKRQWKDPNFRAKTVKGIRDSKSTPEARAKFSELLKTRWADPEGRKIYLAGVRKTAAKMTAMNKGKKQSHEHISKRVQSRKRAMSEKSESTI